MKVYRLRLDCNRIEAEDIDDAINELIGNLGFFIEIEETDEEPED